MTVNDENYWCDSKLGQGDNEFQAQNNHNYNNFLLQSLNNCPSDFANLVMTEPRTERSEVQSQKMNYE